MPKENDREISKSQVIKERAGDKEIKADIRVVFEVQKKAFFKK